MVVVQFFCVMLYTIKKIKYISHHHEQAASFAAESYARSKNDVGCCFVTTGPGGTNTTTGVSSAWIIYTSNVYFGQVLNQTIKNSKKTNRSSRNKHYRYCKTYN